jgi:hypothetical protein
MVSCSATRHDALALTFNQGTTIADEAHAKQAAFNTLKLACGAYDIGERQEGTTYFLWGTTRESLGFLGQLVFELSLRETTEGSTDVTVNAKSKSLGSPIAVSLSGNDPDYQRAKRKEAAFHMIFQEELEKQ